jgi:hypothetical protein
MTEAKNGTLKDPRFLYFDHASRFLPPFSQIEVIKKVVTFTVRVNYIKQTRSILKLF